MPTGYTDAITDTMTLEQFALRCARAFGALIEMRDDHLDAPIPEAFQPSPYSVERLEKAKARVAEVSAMTIEDAAADLKAENKRREKELAKSIARSKDTRTRYERMLAMVDAWEPPTSEHVRLKTFMQEQITSSIQWDCHDEETLTRYSGPIEATPKEWLAKLKVAADEELARAENYLTEETERAKGRTDWVRALRESLRETGT
jgi:hypothetical protein